MVSKSRYAYSYIKGKKAEDLFNDVMVSRGNTIEPASKEDNINKHIDFYVNNKGIDVKGNKTRDSIWLEIKNVKGDKGWLEGEADYIVFDIIDLEAFSFFKRKELLKFVKEIKEKTTNKKDYLKLYTRENRKDIIVRVNYNMIKHLEKQIIFYEKNKKP